MFLFFSCGANLKTISNNNNNSGKTKDYGTRVGTVPVKGKKFLQNYSRDVDNPVVDLDDILHGCRVQSQPPGFCGFL